jgi:uncharacterized protein YbjQ (UPF0145 family)
MRGIVVRSRSLVGAIGASLQTLLGGNITRFTALGEKPRGDAFAMMLDHAAERGANASILVRYDAGALAAAEHSRLCDGGRSGGATFTRTWRGSTWWPQAPSSDGAAATLPDLPPGSAGSA